MGALGVCAMMVLATPALEAQRVDQRIPAGISSVASRGGRTLAGASLPKSESPFRVTVASAILPGSGQLMLRQRRAAAYLALEAAALAYYISQTSDGRRQRDRYRRISREVARATFNPDGPRGDWDYYERMERFVSSGDFDAVPGGMIDPESNEETYNGSVWLLARQTFWRDPLTPPDPASSEYNAALRFYEDRAYPADMRWTWAGEAEAYQQFRSAIKGSNSAFRSAGHTASVMLANHFLSAIDAYVSAQVRLRKNPDGSVSAVASIPLGY
jgi:hypothetical protein